MTLHDPFRVSACCQTRIHAACSQPWKQASEACNAGLTIVTPWACYTRQGATCNANCAAVVMRGAEAGLRTIMDILCRLGCRLKRT